MKRMVELLLLLVCVAVLVCATTKNTADNVSGLTYSYPETYGLSHTAGWFYGCLYETPAGESTLVLLPSLAKTKQTFWKRWSGQRVLLECGTISVGQSIESVNETLEGTEARVQGDRYSYSFNNDFVLTLHAEAGRVAALEVEPLPLYYDGPCYEGIPGLVAPSPTPGS